MREVETNYFAQKTAKVEDLRHFPFSSFKEFKSAVSDGTVVDIGVAMDKARNWVMESKDSPPFWRILSYILVWIPFFFILFYFVAAFILPNYWLIPYALVPLLIFFTGSPIGRRIFPVHYLLIIIFLIAWFITGNFPDLIYWLPLVIEYLILNQLYSGSAGIAQEAIVNDEKTLCLFWKWGAFDLLLADGTRHLQRWVEKDGQTIRYKDIEEEWEEYYEKVLKPREEKSKKR